MSSFISCLLNIIGKTEKLFAVVLLVRILLPETSAWKGFKILFIYRKEKMPRTNVCSEVTIANIRLAVRQVVADFCASPERTIENIVNGQFE